MNSESFLFQAFVYLTAAAVTVPIAHRMGLGSVLGYLLAGVAIGPFMLGWVGREQSSVMHFAEFGVVMMLFLVGLELRPALLWRLRAPILGMGGGQVVFTALLLGVVMTFLFPLPWQAGLAVGLTLACSSTAIVLQTLSEKGLMKTEGGESAFSILLFQDIAVIPILALLPFLATYAISSPEGAYHATGHGIDISSLPGWAQAGLVVGAVGGIIIGGRFLIRPVFRFIAATRLREMFTAVSLLMVIGIALLMQFVGLSAALGTFLAGVVLADSEYRQELESDIEPFKGLLLGLFFISVGAGIDFELFKDQTGRVLLFVLILVAAKFLVLLGVGRAFKLASRDKWLVAFSLAQGGEFAFVLFSFCVQNGVLEVPTAGLLTLVVALSMGTAPILFIIMDKWVLPKLATTKKDGEKQDKVVDEDAAVIVAGFGRFGNIVGRLLRANGIQTTVLEFSAPRVEALRRLGLKVYYGDASRLDLLHSAGAHKARAIVLALDDREKTLELVDTVQQHFPNLKIFARASGRAMAAQLLKKKVENIYRETLDTSLAMGVDTLSFLGVRAHQAHRAAKQFKIHDERAVREVAKVEGDQKAMFSKGRELIRQLEEAVKGDEKTFNNRDDHAWDPETLRDELKETVKKFM